jgi:hypothetical protein
MIASTSKVGDISTPRRKSKRRIGGRKSNDVAAVAPDTIRPLI